MKTIIALIILVTSTTIIAKDIEVVKFKNTLSPNINKDILIKESKNVFGELDASCMTRKFGKRTELSKRFLNILNKAGANFPNRAGFNSNKYGNKYTHSYQCFRHLETSMDYVLEKQFKYYCESSNIGGRNSTFINNMINSKRDDMVYNCEIDFSRYPLADRYAKDWYNQWTTGFDIWSEYMAKDANSKYSNIVAKRNADKAAKLAKQKAVKLKKEKEIANQKKAAIESKKLAIANAIDVSNFDIKGFKLGDSYDDIMGKLYSSCKENNIESSEGIVSTYILECGERLEHDASTKEWLFKLNHDKKIMLIVRSIEFKVQPLKEKIQNQLIKKYGSPNLETEYKTDSGKMLHIKPITHYKNNRTQDILYGGDEVNSYCWGSCKIDKSRKIKLAESAALLQKPYKSFEVYSLTNVYTSLPLIYHYQLKFILLDGAMTKNNDNWKNESKKQQNNKLRNKESELDLFDELPTIKPKNAKKVENKQPDKKEIEQRIAKENSIKDIKSGKSKLSTCDPTVFDSGYGIGLLYSPPINADNKSYVFHRMNIYNKYNDSQILYRYTNTDKMLLVNITPKTYIYQGEGYWQLTTCIIGTVTDIKHINGVTIAVINADYIGISLDGY